MPLPEMCIRDSCKLIFTREESQTASSPRHEMEMHVRLGATKDGIVKGIDLYTLSNTGAYGEHGPTTVGLSGHKSIPLYGKAEAFRFVSDVVYTNPVSYTHLDVYKRQVQGRSRADQADRGCKGC